MSYIPYLRQAPTHTQTGTVAPPTKISPAVVVEADKDPAPAVRTDSDVDPFGPRQWHSSLVELSGKNRALNEFSVERVDEENDQNLVMLHGTLHCSSRIDISSIVADLMIS
jgi:cardiolipin-specific phospholipase